MAAAAASQSQLARVEQYLQAAARVQLPLLSNDMWCVAQGLFCVTHYHEGLEAAQHYWAELDDFEASLHVWTERRNDWVAELQRRKALRMPQAALAALAAIAAPPPPSPSDGGGPDDADDAPDSPQRPDDAPDSPLYVPDSPRDASGSPLYVPVSPTEPPQQPLKRRRAATPPPLRRA